jgi:hypothetical protein
VSEETDRKIPDGVYAIATELLDSGQPAAAVEQQLVAAGVSLETARRIVAEQQRAATAAEKSDGRVDLRFAAMAFAGGVVLLIGNRGHSYVAWFCLIVAAVRFVLGVRRQRRLRLTGG